jgi:hypothetical protein
MMGRNSFFREGEGGASFSGGADFSEGQIFRIEERFFMEVNHFTKYRKIGILLQHLLLP